MSGMQSLVISLGVMQLARRVPFDDPQTLLYVRIGYVASQLITMAVYFYVSLAIKRKNDTKPLKYLEPPSPMSQESKPKLVKTTVKEYDLQEVSKALRAVYTSLAIMGFMHLYLKFTQPLFVQGIMGIKNLFDAKEVSIHILGRPAEGDLKRPFKSGPSMFGGGSQEDQTDEKAIEAAEEEEKKEKEKVEKKDE